MKNLYNNSKHIFVVYLLAIIIASCNTDFLETIPLTEYSEIAVWQGEDPNLMESFLARIYHQIEHGFEKFPSNVYVDDGDARANAGILIANSGGDSPLTTGYWDQWSQVYTAIRYCNIALENIGRSPVDDDIKNRLTGEAHFLRGMLYHHLVRLYGGVPLVKNSYKLSDNFILPRNTFAECIEFIASECDLAAELLPLAHSGNNVGRATRGAALALKSRVLVHAASDLHNSAIFPGYSTPELISYTSGSRDGRWIAARDAAKAVIDLDIYRLYKGEPSPTDSISKNYADLFLSYGTDEDIFLRYFLANWWRRVNDNPLQLYFPIGFGGRGNNVPLGNLVDAFEVADGSKFNWNNPAHSTRPYQNRDPRFHAFIIYEGSAVRDMGRDETFIALDPTSRLQVGQYERWDALQNKKVIQYGVDSRKGPIRPHEASYTGYYIRKAMDTRIDGWKYAQDIPWRYIRYAEVLFNYAEACIELGEEDEARKYLNMIRKRAGMPDITDSGIALKNRFRNEKRVEMMFEDQRYYDVRRWAVGSEAYGPAYAADILYSLNNDHTTAIVPIIKHVVFQTRAWKNKMYFRPIPNSEMLRNNLLIQNPEY